MTKEGFFSQSDLQNKNSTYMNRDLIEPKWVGICNACGKTWLICNRRQIIYCICGHRLKYKNIKKNYA